MTQADWVKELGELLEWTTYKEGSKDILCFSAAYDQGGPSCEPEDVIKFIQSQITLAQQRTEKKCLERVKYRLETYIWDGNIGDGLTKGGGHDYLIEVMENRKLLTKAVLSDLLK